jgi:hypothetical protein
MPSYRDNAETKKNAKDLARLESLLCHRARIPLLDTHLTLARAEELDDLGYIDLVFGGAKEAKNAEIWKIAPQGKTLADSWTHRPRSLPMRIILKTWNTLPALGWRIVEAILAGAVGFVVGRYTS